MMKRYPFSRMTAKSEASCAGFRRQDLYCRFQGGDIVSVEAILESSTSTKGGLAAAAWGERCAVIHAHSACGWGESSLRRPPRSPQDSAMLPTGSKRCDYNGGLSVAVAGSRPELRKAKGTTERPDKGHRDCSSERCRVGCVCLHGWLGCWTRPRRS